MRAADGQRQTVPAIFQGAISLGNDQPRQGNVEGLAFPWATARQQAASESKRKHATWTDSSGADQAASTHPNFWAVRTFMADVQDGLTEDDPDPFAEDWRNRPGCPLELGCVCVNAILLGQHIGTKPTRWHQLATLADPIDVDTLYWHQPIWSASPKATVALLKRAREGDPRARLARWTDLHPLSKREQVWQRFYAAAGQRLWRDCECLPTGHMCPSHAAAALAWEADEEAAQAWQPYSRRSTSGLLIPTHLCTAVHKNPQGAKRMTSYEKFTEVEAKQETAKAVKQHRKAGDSGTELGHMLATLTDRQAHKALGFKTWPLYIDKHFDGLGASQSYQLIRHSGKVRAIEAGLGHTLSVTENHTRKLKVDVLQDVVETAKKKITDGMDSSRAVFEAIAEHKPVKGESQGSDGNDDESSNDTDEPVTQAALAAATNAPVFAPLSTATYDMDLESNLSDAWFAQVEALFEAVPNKAAVTLLENNLPRLRIRMKEIVSSA